MKHLFRYGLLLLCCVLQGAPLDEPLPDIAALHRAFLADPENNEAAWDNAMQRLNDRIERQVFQVDATYRDLKARTDAAQQALDAATKEATLSGPVLDTLSKFQTASAELEKLSPDGDRSREIELKRRECQSLARQLRFKISTAPKVKAAAGRLADAQSILGERSRFLIEHSSLPAAKVFRDAVARSESSEKRSNVRFAGCYQSVGNPFIGFFAALPPDKLYESTSQYYQYLTSELKRENPQTAPERIDNYVKMRCRYLPAMPGDGQAALQPGETPIDELLNAITAYHAQTADADATVLRLRRAAAKMPRQSTTRMETLRMVTDLPGENPTPQNRRNTAKNEARRRIASDKVNDLAAPHLYNYFEYDTTKEEWPELEKEIAGVGGVNPWLREMVAGRAAMARAWRARGGGFSDTVSTDGWQIFTQEFENARGHFLNAAKLLPESDQPYAELIEIEAGNGTIDKRIAMFKEVIKRNPTNGNAYVNLIFFTLPRWGGSHELILQLADALLDYPDYNTVIPAYAFDAMSRIALDYQGYRWKQVYLRDGVIAKGDRLFAERLKVENRPGWKEFALYHRALFEMATLRYDQAAATVAELGGEKKFTELFDNCWWSGTGSTGWFARMPSEGRISPVLLRLFTGPQCEKLRVIEKRYLGGDDQARAELAELIKTGSFSPDEKDVLIDLYGRWGIDLGLDYYAIGGRPLNSFQVAGSEGYPFVLEEMLKLGFNYSKYENYPGETAVLIAENGTNPELLEILKDAGDPLNRPEPRNKRAPMHVAAFEPNAIMIKKLLELGVSPTAPDGENHTPVQMAAARRGVEATMLLLAAGADVDVRDNDGDTALMFVMEQNSPRPIWEALIAKSKDLNIANNRGMTALHYAARLTEDPAVIQAMLKAGADPRKADSAGQTPIDVARERGRADFVKLMGKQ